MRRLLLPLLAPLLLAACAGTYAQNYQDKVSFAFSYGEFIPTSSGTRDTFDSAWTRIALKTFDPTKPAEWRFVTEGGYYKASGPTSAKLIPLTCGFERGFGESDDAKTRPYVTLRAGPYYGKVETPAIGLEETTWGLNVNASAGLVFNRRFYVEARYDYFSRFAGFNFDGLSLSAGVRLFDISL